MRNNIKGVHISYFVEKIIIYWVNNHNFITSKTDSTHEIVYKINDVVLLKDRIFLLFLKL